MMELGYRDEMRRYEPFLLFYLNDISEFTLPIYGELLA